MRTRNNSLLTALALLSLVVGSVGCKMNGGPWYKPGSYSMHNPFKSKDDTAPAYYATPKPSIEAQPNVTPPPGGYATRPERHVQPHYGNTITGGLQSDADRLAMSGPPVHTGGPYPETGTYNPNAVPHNPHLGMPPHSGPHSSNPGVMPPHYQTSLVQPAPTSDYAPHYSPVPGTYDYDNPNSSTPLPWGHHVPQDSAPHGGGHSPPMSDGPPPGGFVPASPSYDNTVPPGGFGSPSHSYGATAPSYGTTGYTANPSTVSGYSGF